MPAHVVIAARRKGALAELASRINALGGSAESVALDVTDFASIEAISPSLAKLDILVNNAGIVREVLLLNRPKMTGTQLSTPT